MTTSPFLRQAVFLFLGFLLVLSSCKKDELISVKSEQTIHLDEAKKWVDEHPTAQIIGLDWSKGKLLTAKKQQVIRVPVLNDDRLSRIRNSSTKDVLNSVITGSNEPGGNKENDNPNYSPGHPPAVFFMKDSNDRVNGYLLNFVPTDKNKENGSDGIWTGKLYQWNMKGDTLLVLNYEKSKIIDRYLTGPVRNKAEASSFAKLATLKPYNQVGSIWSWLKTILSAVWDALNWLGYHLGIPGAYPSNNPYWWYGGRGDGEGGGNQTTEHDLDDSVYPLYLAYGGASHYAPTLTDVDVLLIQLGIQDDILAQYLEDDLANGGTVATQMKTFINANGNSAESHDFARWAITYLSTNSSLNTSAYGLIPKLELIKNINLATDEFNYINTHGYEAEIVAEVFKEDNNVSENAVIAGALIEMLADMDQNTSTTSGQKLDGLKDVVRNAITEGIVASAKLMRKVYLRVNRLSQENPSIITYSNTYVIDPIRGAVSNLVDFNAQTMSWKDLFLIWGYELGSFPTVNGNPTISITGNANVIVGTNLSNAAVNAFKNLESVNDLRSDIISKLKSGILQVGETRELYYNYNVSEYYGSLAEQNAAKIFLGSFNTIGKVITRNGNTATIEFSAENVSGWESATRFIRATGGNQGIINNKSRGSGLHLGGNFGQKYEWAEVITW